MLFKTAVSTSKFCAQVPVYRQLYPKPASLSTLSAQLRIRTMATHVFPKCEPTDPAKVPNPLGQGKFIQ